MNEADYCEILTHGEIEVHGRVQGSSNQALLVTVSYNGVDIDACYKTELGERPLWDFPGGLWRREVAAYQLDRALGFDVVPTTVGRDDGPYGSASIQRWIEEPDQDHYFTLMDRRELQPWFQQLCAFDVVANNTDRKSGHVIFDGGRCWAIDNGLTFHEDDKLRTVIWEFAGEPLPDAVRGSLETFGNGEAQSLLEWLTPSAVAVTQVRALELAALGVFPSYSEDAEWPPYPWPLV
jgi:hypothetical protein